MSTTSFPASSRPGCSSPGSGLPSPSPRTSSRDLSTVCAHCRSRAALCLLLGCSPTPPSSLSPLRSPSRSPSSSASVCAEASSKDWRRSGSWSSSASPSSGCSSPWACLPAAARRRRGWEWSSSRSRSCRARTSRSPRCPAGCRCSPSTSRSPPWSTPSAVSRSGRGHPTSYYIARSLVWAAAILAVSVPLAVAKYQRG
jgi:hypothetical protein